MQFEGLVIKLSPKLKAIAHKLGLQYRLFDEKDFYQEELAHLWVNYESGKLSGKTDSYILQGCFFHLKNYIRKEFRKADVISLDSASDKDGQPAPDRLMPASDFDKTAYLLSLSDKLLADAILNNGLSTKEKEVLKFYAQGLTTRQIGGRLGVSHVSVVKMTKSIREKCRRYCDMI